MLSSRWLLGRWTPRRMSARRSPGPAPADQTTSRELAEVLEILPEAVVVVGRDGRLEHVNEIAREFGTPEQLATRDVVAVVEVTRRDGTPVDDVEVEVDRAGVRRRIRLSTRALDRKGPAPYRVVVVGTDITDRHDAREALRASEERHRTIVESLHEGVVMQQPDGQIVKANLRAQELLGLSLEQMLGRTSVDPRWRAVHADGTDWPGHEHPVSRAIASGGHVGPETMGIHTPDGRLRWLEVNATPLLDDDRQVLSAVASFVDVTARRAAETALTASESELRVTLESLAEGVILYDAALETRTANPAAELIFPNPRGRIGQFEGDEEVEFLGDDGEPLTQAHWPAVIANRTGRTVRGTIVGLRRGGVVERWIEISAAAVGDLDGHGPWPVVASFVDVTERRQREATLAAAQERVQRSEAEARQRAADLAAVGRIAHQLATETDLARARTAICTAARQTADATIAMLLQPDARGRRLECTAAANLEDHERFSVDLTGEPSGSALAFETGQPYFVEDCVGHPAVNRTIVDATAMRSAVWQPVLKDGRAIAVLAVGWEQRLDALPSRLEEMLGLLAAEAAVAIDRAALIARLDDTARTDPLTGAPNRRALDERLAADLARAADRAEPLCVAMVDLDHFKRYNDAHGHPQGDRLLKEAVAAWMREIRSTDLLARYGGEEFCVVLPSCSLAPAVRLAERLRHLMPYGQTCSIGVAQWDAAESAPQLLARADQALYDAKHRGRDRTTVAGTDAGPAGGAAERAVSQVVLRSARRLLGMDLAFLAQIDGDRLVFRDLEGRPDRFGLTVDDHIELADSYCQRMIDGRIEPIVGDAAAHHQTAGLAVTRQAAIGSYIGAPVALQDGRILGTLCALRTDPAPDLGARELSVLRGLAQVVARHFEDLLGGRIDAASIEGAWQHVVEQLTREP